MAEYSGEEVSTICGEIQKRIRREMKDEDFDSFKLMLQPPLVLCKHCEGTGCFFDGKGLTVCRSCNYHRSRGRTLNIEAPESIRKAMK